MTRHDELLAEAVLREVRGLTTLHAVGDYDPAKASVRCTFDRLTED